MNNVQLTSVSFELAVSPEKTNQGIYFQNREFSPPTGVSSAFSAATAAVVVVVTAAPSAAAAVVVVVVAASSASCPWLPAIPD